MCACSISESFYSPLRVALRGHLRYPRQKLTRCVTSRSGRSWRGDELNTCKYCIYAD